MLDILGSGSILSSEGKGRLKFPFFPADWPWSSYRAVIGEAPAPPWLDTDWMFGQFGGERLPAICAHRQFALAGKGESSPWIRFGTKCCRATRLWFCTHKAKGAKICGKCPRPSGGRSRYRERHPDRVEAMSRAYFSGPTPWPR